MYIEATIQLIDKVLRKRFLRLFVVIAFSCVSFTSIAETEKHALVIGISDYFFDQTIKDLKYADKDAIAVGEALDQLGYDVHQLTNKDATRINILEAFRHYASVLDEDDEFVLYFSGHGARDPVLPNTTFWLTNDADTNHLDRNAIRVSHLSEYIAGIPAKRKLVLLDHCFSGDVELESSTVPATDVASGESKDVTVTTTKVVFKGPIPKNLRKRLVREAAGVVVIAAARGLAFESEDLQHGVFTKALLNALTSRTADSGIKDNKLSLLELIQYINETIDSLTPTGAPKQKIRTSESVDDSADWIITANLPVDSTDQIAKYRVTIKLWAQQKKIPYAVRQRTLDALSTATDSSALAGLPPEQQTKWRALAEYVIATMKPQSSTEAMKTRALIELVEDFDQGNI